MVLQQIKITNTLGLYIYIYIKSGMNVIMQVCREMKPVMEMRIKMENKGPLLFSSLLSSRPHSLLSTAVCMARLFSLTGCESHETGGHQGPKPPRQHAPPQSAAHSIPQHSLCLHTNNFLHHFKYFIPQALCFSLPLTHSFFVKSCLSSSRLFSP